MSLQNQFITTAERTARKWQLGEILHDQDTGQKYLGDLFTVGGIPLGGPAGTVTSINGQSGPTVNLNLDDLADVAASAATTNQVLKRMAGGGFAFAAESVVLPIDNLTSTSAVVPLSANMGRVLDGEITNLELVVQGLDPNRQVLVVDTASYLDVNLPAADAGDFVRFSDSGTVTINGVPTEVQRGDLLRADADGTAAATPAGWTFIPMSPVVAKDGPIVVDLDGTNLPSPYTLPDPSGIDGVPHLLNVFNATNGGVIDAGAFPVVGIDDIANAIPAPGEDRVLLHAVPGFVQTPVPIDVSQADGAGDTETWAIVPTVVELRRGATGGLYNSVSEAGWAGGTSPANTEWRNATNTTFTDFQSSYDGTIGTNILTPAYGNVEMRVVSTGQIIPITFTAWQTGGGGGFTASSIPVYLTEPGWHVRQIDGGDKGNGSLFEADQTLAAGQIRAHTLQGDLQFSGIGPVGENMELVFNPGRFDLEYVEGASRTEMVVTSEGIFHALVGDSKFFLQDPIGENPFSGHRGDVMVSGGVGDNVLTGATPPAWAPQNFLPIEGQLDFTAAEPTGLTQSDFGKRWWNDTAGAGSVTGDPLVVGLYEYHSDIDNFGVPGWRLVPSDGIGLTFGAEAYLVQGTTLAPMVNTPAVLPAGALATDVSAAGTMTGTDEIGTYLFRKTVGGALASTLDSADFPTGAIVTLENNTGGDWTVTPGTGSFVNHYDAAGATSATFVVVGLSVASFQKETGGAWTVVNQTPPAALPGSIGQDFTADVTVSGTEGVGLYHYRFQDNGGNDRTLTLDSSSYETGALITVEAENGAATLTLASTLNVFINNFDGSNSNTTTLTLTPFSVITLRKETGGAFTVSSMQYERPDWAITVIDPAEDTITGTVTNGGGPQGFPVTFTPDEDGYYVLRYAGDAVNNSNAGIVVGTAALGSDVLNTVAVADRLTPGILEKHYLLELEAGTEYFVTVFGGGGGGQIVNPTYTLGPVSRVPVSMATTASGNGIFDAANNGGAILTNSITAENGFTVDYGSTLFPGNGSAAQHLNTGNFLVTGIAGPGNDVTLRASATEIELERRNGTETVGISQPSAAELQVGMESTAGGARIGRTTYTADSVTTVGAFDLDIATIQADSGVVNLNSTLGQYNLLTAPANAAVDADTVLGITAAGALVNGPTMLELTNKWAVSVADPASDQGAVTISNGVPYESPVTFTPEADGLYVLRYYADSLASGNAGIQIGTTLGDLDVFRTNTPAERLTPALLERYYIVELDAGTTYFITPFSGGGSTNLVNPGFDLGPVSRVPITAASVVEGIDTTLAVGEVLTALRTMDQDSFEYRIVSDDGAGTTTNYRKLAGSELNLVLEAGNRVGAYTQDAEVVALFTQSLTNGRRATVGVGNGSALALNPGDPAIFLNGNRDGVAGIVLPGDPLIRVGANGESDFAEAAEGRWINVNSAITLEIGKKYRPSTNGAQMTFPSLAQGRVNGTIVGFYPPFLGWNDASVNALGFLASADGEAVLPQPVLTNYQKLEYCFDANEGVSGTWYPIS